MGKYRLRLLMISVVMVLLSIPASIPASAQDRTVYWQRWDVHIDNVDVNQNVFDVSEQYDLQFNGTFRFGSAVIPDTNLNSISDIQVYEDGSPLTANCSENQGTFCVERVDEGISIVYYFKRSISNDTQNFEI